MVADRSTFTEKTFIGLPFVVRTLQPALADLDKEMEEAAGHLKVLVRGES